MHTVVLTIQTGPISIWTAVCRMRHTGDRVVCLLLIKITRAAHPAPAHLNHTAKLLQ